MHRCRAAVTLLALPVLFLGFCIPLTLSGCGSDAPVQEVKVTKKPEDVAKDSMNFYLQGKNKKTQSQTKK
jgi:hypothetical protein